MDNNEWPTTELCAALHALSLDTAEAVGVENARFRRPEQLALRFGNAVLRAIEEPDLELTPLLMKSLNELAVLLNSMSAQSGALWTADAVLNDPSWRQVQTLAREALGQLGASGPAQIH